VSSNHNGQLGQSRVVVVFVGFGVGGFGLLVVQSDGEWGYPGSRRSYRSRQEICCFPFCWWLVERPKCESHIDKPVFRADIPGEQHNAQAQNGGSDQESGNQRAADSFEYLVSTHFHQWSVVSELSHIFTTQDKRFLRTNSQTPKIFRG
jgi:hypothetical protein